MMRSLVIALTLALSFATGATHAGTDVHIGINVGTPPPPVVIESRPQLVVVPRTPVYYAPALPYNVFSYAGHYYTYEADTWYWAADYHGPWFDIGIERVPRHILAVPVAYYKVPPGHWKKHGRPPWAGKGRKHHRHHHHDDD